MDAAEPMTFRFTYTFGLVILWCRLFICIDKLILTSRNLATLIRNENMLYIACVCILYIYKGNVLSVYREIFARYIYERAARELRARASKLKKSLASATW